MINIFGWKFGIDIEINDASLYFGISIFKTVFIEINWWINRNVKLGIYKSFCTRAIEWSFGQIGVMF